ncbi:MAG: DUF6882 domain-containing protein [Phenylobacterium sp.]
MDAPPWYAAWRHEAVHELGAKQDRLKESFQVGAWPRYDYDVDAGTLTFSDASGPKVMAEIQIVGTTGPKDWLWSWANSHWSPPSYEDVLRVRAFGEEHGIAELTSDYLEDEDLNALGWEMTAVAARVLDAAGAYRPPRDNGGGLFLVYRSIKFVS